MGKENWGDLQSSLSQAENEANNTLNGPLSFVDRVTVVEVGSFLGRTLSQYREILSHNGAPDPVDFAKSMLPSDFATVDVGCGAGVALMNLRTLFPSAQLHGIDVRDVELNTLRTSESQIKVGQLFRHHQINFHHDSLLNISNLFPSGYDLLLCVGSFFDSAHYSGSLQLNTLQLFYAGLKKGGIAEVYIGTDDAILARMSKEMSLSRINHQFYPADPQIAKKNALFYPGYTTGTMVLGPKL